MAKHVISFQYTLTNKTGEALDASEPGHPLIFMTGSGQIIPGLEEILIEMNKTDKKTVTIPAKDAYGEYDERLIYKVDRAKLPTQDLKVGDMFEAGEGEHFFPVSVRKIEGNEIVLDGNHPLAGQDLTFAVEIADKRLATADEVAHGHVHGAGGCAH
jgi:FKBP-type peptidyl-prolyl cis-trans isomerase SlyD